MQNKLTITFNKIITSFWQNNLTDHIHFAYDQNELHAKALFNMFLSAPVATCLTTPLVASTLLNGRVAILCSLHCVCVAPTMY